MDETTRAAIKQAERLYKAGNKAAALAALRRIDDPAARRIAADIAARGAEQQPDQQDTEVLRGMRNLKIAGWIMMVLAALSGAFYVLSLGGGRGDVLLLASSITLLVGSLVISGVSQMLTRIIVLLTDQRTLLKALVQPSAKTETAEVRAALIKPRARE